MAKDVKARKSAALATPDRSRRQRHQGPDGRPHILLADVYALYIKTKNFHWHMSGPHFRDYHLLLDDQATEIDAMTDVIAERVRKLGGGTIRSIGHIKRLQRVLDNDADFVTPLDMLAELRDDNIELTKHMRSLHEVCDEHNDTRHGQPDRKLDRRDREAHLVPVRDGTPHGGVKRGLTDHVLPDREPLARS